MPAWRSRLQPDQLTKRLEDVMQAGQRAAELTQQLLAYSGKGRFLVQAIPLSQLVRQIVGLIQVSLPKKVRLDLRLDESRLPWKATAGRSSS